VCVCVCVCVERWRFSKLVRVKQLPLTVRVDSVDEHQHPAADAGEDDADLDLTGHELRLIAVNNARFLRANAINNGLRPSPYTLHSTHVIYTVFIILYTSH